MNMEIVRSQTSSEHVAKSLGQALLETSSVAIKADGSASLGRVIDSSFEFAARAAPEASVPRVLVYDGDDESCALVAECLKTLGVEALFCTDPDDVVSEISNENNLLARDHDLKVDLLVWGLSAPYEGGQYGLEALRRVRESAADVRLVLVAPQEALAFAPAIKALSADSFILKPLRPQDLKLGIDRALRRPRVKEAKVIAVDLGMSFTSPSSAMLVDERQSSSNDSGPDASEYGLIGTSPEMKRVASLIRRVARSSVNVLITGESGTGKEMVASAIHKASDRAKKPFIAINCAAIPRELLESELFGHAKGAFTGATTSRRGIFEEAHEGTLLLDEIGDLPLSLQAKILRLLQTRQVKPLGQNVTKEVDVRIMSATHKNLKQLMQKGEFREDLYYRLNVMPIHLPPLRERKDDILQLAEFFLKRDADRRKGRGAIRPLVLTRRASAKLAELPWKGNVRELENVIERAIVLSDGLQITEHEIVCEEAEPTRATTEDLFNAGMSLKDIEREYIKYVLTRTGNKKETATRILGIDRKTLYRKEKLYGIRGNGDRTSSSRESDDEFEG